MLSSICGKLFIVYLPPPSERGIDNLLFTVTTVFWCLWGFFIVHNVTLILIAWISPVFPILQWRMKAQRLKIILIKCQPVLCVPNPKILELTFQGIYNFASKMKNCLKFSFQDASL